jgi:hypothetical protein
MRRSQAFSIFVPLLRNRSTTLFMRLVFQAITMFFSSACAAEITFISSRRPRSCDTLAGMDRALQLVHRFATAEQRVDLAPEVLDRDVVAQEDASQPPPEVLCGLVRLVGPRWAAEALHRKLRADAAVEVHNFC